MKVIQVDGSSWVEPLDLFEALATLLGAGPEHGRNFAAFEDSVFYGGMLAVDPPLKVIVANCPDFACKDVETMIQGWSLARNWKRENYGEDVEASIEFRD